MVIGAEDGSDCGGLLKPNREKSENRGSTNCCEEATPVVTDREVRGGYFDAEEHTWNIPKN